jgi:hypothetical protein
VLEFVLRSSRQLLFSLADHPLHCPRQADEVFNMPIMGADDDRSSSNDSFDDLGLGGLGLKEKKSTMFGSNGNALHRIIVGIDFGTTFTGTEVIDVAARRVLTTVRRYQLGGDGWSAFEESERCPLHP